MSHASIQRRRGGQPANTNRLTHGLYSNRVAPAAPAAPVAARFPNPAFQIELARKRLSQVLQLQRTVRTLDQWLSFERCVLHYLSLMSGLNHYVLSMAARDASALGDHDGHPSSGELEKITVSGDQELSSKIGTSSAPQQVTHDSPLDTPIRTSNRSTRSSTTVAADKEQ
jgi:hypothetical protein